MVSALEASAIGGRKRRQKKTAWFSQGWLAGRRAVVSALVCYDAPGASHRRPASHRSPIGSSHRRPATKRQQPQRKRQLVLEDQSAAVTPEANSGVLTPEAIAEWAESEAWRWADPEAMLNMMIDLLSENDVVMSPEGDIEVLD